MVAAWLGAATAVPAGAGQPAIVVAFDPGGEVGARQQQIRQLRRSGQRVELRGTCLSACTMYLGLRNVCVAPQASFGFHGPQSPFGGMPRDVFDHWSQVLSDRFHPQLQHWFMSTARHAGPGLLTLRGDTLIRMGYAAC